MEIILSCGYTAFFLFLLGRMRFFTETGIKTTWLQGVFLLKILAGIALWWLYTYYYTDRTLADIHKYFDDSKILFDSLSQKPGDFIKMLFGFGMDDSFDTRYFEKMNNWYKPYAMQDFNDNRSMIRFNALARIFSMGFYQVHGVMICFLSLAGLTALYKSFIGYLSDKKTELFCAVFLIPSVLFWGSGVLKEGLIFFIIGFLMLSFQKILAKIEIWINGIWFLIFAFLLLNTKNYILIAMIPGMASLLVIRLIPKIKPIPVFIFFFIFFFCAGNFVNSIFTTINPAGTLKKKQEDFIALGKGGLVIKDINTFVYFPYGDRTCLITDRDSMHVRIKKGCVIRVFERATPEDTVTRINKSDSIIYTIVKNVLPTHSYIEIPRLSKDPVSFVRAAPVALFNSFLRPLPNEINSLFMLLSMFENLFILFIVIVVLFFLKRKMPIGSMALFCISFILILYLIIGWTTPIIGAIARYKVPALPFLVIFILFLYDKEKLLLRYSILKTKLSSKTNT